METTQYTIPVANMPALQERIEKLNRRAKKLHTQPITLKVVDHVKKDITDSIAPGVEKKRTVHYDVIEVTGEAPHVPGFTFVATAQFLPTESGESVLILRNVPGQEIPEWYRKYVEANPQQCDHCHQNRRRNDTFIIRKDDEMLGHSGERVHQQIGRNCLADFLGGIDPHNLASQAEFLASVEDACRGYEEDGMFSGTGGGQTAYDLLEVLVATAMVIRLDGWLSRGRAREMMPPGKASADTVDDFLSGAFLRWPADERRAFELKYIATDADAEKAKLVYDWLQTIEPNGNDYLLNLQAVAKLDYSVRRTLGIACSAIAAYDRAMGKVIEREKRAERSNEFVGEVGKRIKSMKLTLTKLLGPYYTDFGAMSICIFEDEKGNGLAWKTNSNSVNAPNDTMIGKTFDAAFSVKSHYTKDEKWNTTYISRVVLKEVKE